MFDQSQLLPKLRADLSRIKGRPLFPVRDKKDRVPRAESCQRSQLLLLFPGNELVDRPLVAQILRHFQIPQTAHAQIHGKPQQLLMEAFGHLRMYPDGTNCPVMEGFELTPLEKCRQVNNAQRVPQIRLIASELQHGLLIADHRIGRLRYRITGRRKFLKNRRQHFLAHTKYILLRGKTHFEIQLVELSR